MRDNDDMEVITRTEFEDQITMFITKEDLNAALTETKNDIVATVTASMADTKVDMIESVKSTLSHHWVSEKMRGRDAVTEAKIEILAVLKKNILEATAPLATTAELQDAIAPLTTKLDGVEARLGGLEARLGGLEARQQVIAKNVEETMPSMTEGFDRLEARLKATGV